MEMLNTILHIQLHSKRVIIFLKLMSYEIIACFIEEKEQNKLDCHDPKILEQKSNGLLFNFNIKIMVNLK